MLGVRPTQVVRETDVRAFHLVACPALELLHDLDALPDARCTEGVTHGQKAAVRIDGDLTADLDLLRAAELRHPHLSYRSQGLPLR